METELELYTSVFETVLKYLIPVLATNYLTDVVGRYVPLKLKFQLMPVICIFFATLTGLLYGYIEETDRRETVEHVLSILTISGLLFMSGAYKAMKNRLNKLIKKEDKDENK